MTIFKSLEVLQEDGQFALDARDYTIGISSCARSKIWQNACWLFAAMPSAAVQRNVFTYSAAWTASSPLRPSLALQTCFYEDITQILRRWYDIYIYIAIIEYICRWDRTSYNDIKVSELWNECSHWADVPTLEATNGWFTSNLTFLSRFPFKDFPYSLTILNPYQRLWASEISASSSVPQIPRGSRSRSRFVCLSLFLIWGSHHCVWEGQSVAASIEFLRLHVCCNCWPECHQLQCSY